MSNVRNKPRLFIDFDGTLADNKERYYELYKIAKIKFALNIFNKDAYWRYKTLGCSEKNILLKNNQQSPALNEYLSFRSDHIEDKNYLVFDKPVVRRDLLKKAGDYYDLYLITMRRSGANLLWELNKLNIPRYFKHIVCRGDLPAKDIKTCDEVIQKRKLLAIHRPFQPGDILIGDTDLDYGLGRHFRLKTFLVCSGIRQKKALLGNRIPGKILYKDINVILRKLCR